MASNITNKNENMFVKNVCSNTKTDFIEITEDKLENILMKYLNVFKKTQNWITPLSIFLTIFVTVLTAEFQKDFLGISKYIWCAIFYLSLFLSVIWLIVGIIDFFRFSNKSKIEILLRTIKNKSEEEL